MDAKLNLDAGVVESCRQTAAQIARRMAEETSGKTTLSVERAVARFLGVDGISELDIPLPNALVDHVHDGGELGRGIAYRLGNAMLQTGRGAQQLAEAIGAGELDICALEPAEDWAIRELVEGECRMRMSEVRRRHGQRREQRDRLGGPPPLRYVLSATGNVYDDVVHAIAVAETAATSSR